MQHWSGVSDQRVHFEECAKNEEHQAHSDRGYKEALFSTKTVSEGEDEQYSGQKLDYSIDP